MHTIAATDSELEQMYVQDGLSLQQIATRFGVSKQAIHFRLTRAAVKLRPRNPERDYQIDMARLRTLLLDEGISIKNAALQFGVPIRVAAKAAKRLSVTYKKYRCRALPALNTIKVGQSLTFPKTGNPRRDYFRFYYFAACLDITLRVKTIDKKTVRVTRVA